MKDLLWRMTNHVGDAGVSHRVFVGRPVFAAVWGNSGMTTGFRSRNVASLKWQKHRLFCARNDGRWVQFTFCRSPRRIRQKLDLELVNLGRSLLSTMNKMTLTIYESLYSESVSHCLWKNPIEWIAVLIFFRKQWIPWYFSSKDGFVFPGFVTTHSLSASCPQVIRSPLWLLPRKMGLGFYLEIHLVVLKGSLTTASTSSVFCAHFSKF